jgi:uncharacterized protein YkwD
MPKGVSAEIVQKQDAWYELRYAGQTGWTVDWLIKEISTTNVVATSSSRRGTYVGLGRVRSIPSLTGTVVSTMSKGSVADILDESAGWYKVRTANGAEGWTVGWLLVVETNSESTPIASSVSVPMPIVTNVSTTSNVVVPDGVDVSVLNTYWVDKINTLRRAQSLRELVLDQRFVNTANEYAAYMGATGAHDHSRSDGKTMHQWIDTKGLQFTTRNSIGGWKTNYFTENITWGVSQATTASVQSILDRALNNFLAEGVGGAHYNSIYHADWNSVGVGFDFRPMGDDRYQVSIVFHYGSLVR